MGKRGTLTVRVVSDTKAAEQGLDRFSTKVSSTGDKLEGAGKKMTMFATVPVVAVMAGATKAASELEQAAGGTEAVFGDARDTIDEYAQSSARAMGLSEREFREATTSIGGQLKRMTGDVDLAADQSIKLAGVAADLAATYGGTTAEAVQALGSAFRGEADPAERFNLNLKIGAVNARAVELGLAATTSTVDDNARAQATLALIMEQSADAQGQFAREADTAAGSAQIAKAEFENAAAELGDSLAPLAAKAAGGLADLARGFSDLPESIQSGVLALAGVVAVMGPLLSVSGKVLNVLPKIADQFDTLRIKAWDMSSGMKANIAVLGGLGVAFVAADQLAKHFEDRVESVDAVIGDLAGSSTDALVTAFNDIATELQGTAFESDTAEAQLALFRATAEENIGTATRLRDALAEEGQETAELDAVLRDVASSQQRAAADTDASTEAVGRFGEAEDDAIPPTKELTEEVETAADKHKALEDRIRGVNDALKASLDPLFATREALNDHTDAQRNLDDAHRDTAQAQRELNWIVGEHGPKSDQAAEAARNLEEAQRKVEEADRAVVESALDVSSATAELTAKMEAGEVSMENAATQLASWVEQGLITEEQAMRTAGELQGVADKADLIDGRDVVMDVRLRNFRETLAQLDWLAGMAGAPLLNNASVAARDRATEGAVVTNNITLNYPTPETGTEGTLRALRKIGGAM